MTNHRVVAALPSVWVERVGPVDGVDVVGWNLDGAPARADEIAYVCMPYELTAGHWTHLHRAPNARTVQLLSAGFEHALPHLLEGQQLANARGVHDAGAAEQALALTLAMQRGVWHWVENHRQQHWEGMTFSPGLGDQRVLVLGYGSIGSAIARRVAAFDPASITAVASTAREGDELVDRVHGVDELPELLGEQDVVICVLPGNEATTGLIDADFLGRMRPGALLVNVGRGSVVDTDALLAACRAGHVRAGLDVTDPEPLPDGHPLWTCPGVLVSPHVGGYAHIFWSRATAMLRRQLQHLAAGEAVEHLVA